LKTTTEVYDLVTADIRRINMLRGGSRSGKTYALIQIAVKWLLEGTIGGEILSSTNSLGQTITLDKGVFLITRETMPALRMTVISEMKDFLWEIDKMKFIVYKRSTQQFIYKRRQIQFMSLDDEQKILGLKTAFFWLNEGNLVPFDIFKQLLRRCSGRCFCDYNPWSPGSWLNQELEQKRRADQGDVSLTLSTFLMNPYLEESIIKELKGYEENDPDAWLVYGLGEWAKLTGVVYPKWEYFDEENPEGKVAYGLDFGFNHATALVKVTKSKDRKLYWEQVIYQNELTTADIITLLDEMKFSKMARIIADSARPDQIEDIRRAGYRIKGSKKGKVFARIQAVKKYKLFAKGEKLIQELKMYRWKEDRDGSEDRQPLKDEPEKRFDDSMDAAGYATMYLHRSSTFKIL